MILSRVVSRTMFTVSLVIATAAVRGGEQRSSLLSPAIPGGELQILDEQGRQVGACPLKYTDVKADIVGFFGRVTVKQTFHNPLDYKIEAVYVFPLPQDAAVDNMVMTVGDRRIVGQIKRREEAREVYEAAKAAGHVASLLDQERPNIFTQSVANIEPGVQVVIEISYVETLKYEDGVFEWVFPMVVGPRYIPGGGSAKAPMTRGTPAPQVPDADRITPPVTPKGTRAGHDISMTVHIDGGMELFDLQSTLHKIAIQTDGPTRATVALKTGTTIPNKDFILHYRLATDEIADAFLVHGDERGRFFTLILQPPRRVIPDQLVPRELIFVLDSSGSMSGFPIEKAKEVMDKEFASMQPFDTFNLITFAGDTRILWDEPRPNTNENRAEAQEFLASRKGGGGTEMMKAINAALIQPGSTDRPLTPDELAGMPGDGRKVVLSVSPDEIFDWPPPNVRSNWTGTAVQPTGGKVFEIKDLSPEALAQVGDHLVLTGRWQYKRGRRILKVESHTWSDAAPLKTDAIRVVCFMTDGYVGNDMAIIEAVKNNAASTRVFSFGVGNSVNRFLLDGMARAGRGEVEYVMLASQGDAAVERFHERILAPVLTDIEIDWGELPVADVYPKHFPDLFSAKPLVIYGRLTGPAKGTITLRGNTGGGPLEEAIEVTAPEDAADHDALATLWARKKVADLMMGEMGAVHTGDVLSEPEAQARVKSEITNLGLEFRLMTQFTSFVAVEEMFVTVGGEPVRVDVPVEMPDGVSYEGVFGRDRMAGAQYLLYGGSGGSAGKSMSLMRASAKPMPPPMPAEGKPPPSRRTRGLRGVRTADLAESESLEADVRFMGLDEDIKWDEMDDSAKDAVLRRKLSEVLRALAAKVAKEGKNGNLTVGKLEVIKWKVDVMVFLRNLSDETLEALEKLGFTKTGESKTVKLLIGTIDVRKLEDLAKLGAVIRVKSVVGK